MSGSSLSWSWGPANVRVVRWLFYAPTTALGGVLGFIALALAAVLPALAADPLDGVTVGLLAVAVVLALFRGRLLLLVTRSIPRSRVASEFEAVSRPLWHVVAAFVGAVTLVVLVRTSRAVWALAAGAVLLSASALAGFAATAGAFADRDTLRYGAREIELTDVARVRRVSLGGVAVCWLSLRPTASYGTPRLLVVPRSVARRVATAADAERPAPDDSGARPAVYRTMLALGVVFVALGALLGVAVSLSGSGDAGDRTVMGVYVGVAVGGLGLLFLLLAGHEA